jgi:hypothetical protein
LARLLDFDRRHPTRPTTQADAALEIQQGTGTGLEGAEPPAERAAKAQSAAEDVLSTTFLTAWRRVKDAADKVIDQFPVS